jgi:hypothetical protein
MGIVTFYKTIKDSHSLTPLKLYIFFIWYKTLKPYLKVAVYDCYDQRDRLPRLTLLSYAYARFLWDSLWAQSSPFIFLFFFFLKSHLYFCC